MLPRVHILGLGNVGKFIAHSLVQAGKADVTLLLHRDGLQQSFDEAGRAITLIPTSQNGEPVVQAGFQTERAYGVRAYEPDIKNLIVATKANTTIRALENLSHRLTGSSEILMVQNGLGTISQAISMFKKLSKSGLHGAMPVKMPNLYSGILTHGINSYSQWHIVHAGLGTLKVGTAVNPNDPDSRFKSLDALPKSALLQALVDTPQLHCNVVPLREMHKLQLQKLAVNAVINPLTTLFGIHNGALLDAETYPRVVEVMPVLAAELSRPLTWEAKMRRIPEAREVLTPDSILEAVRTVANRTAKNISSMLQDVRAKRETEIDFINGYVHERALQAHMACPLNHMLMNLIKTTRLDYTSSRPSEGLMTRWLERLPILERLKELPASAHDDMKWSREMRNQKKDAAEKAMYKKFLAQARKKADLLTRDPKGTGLGNWDDNPWAMTRRQMAVIIRDDLKKLKMWDDRINEYIAQYQDVPTHKVWKRKLKTIVLSTRYYINKRHLLDLEFTEEEVRKAEKEMENLVAEQQDTKNKNIRWVGGKLERF